ncbi:MAG TPA: hypothetical protein PKA95_00095 [Thermomicrobiales bacterium]|nr:hypothetical protein [Thermomicrobiales bacterium]
MAQPQVWDLWYPNAASQGLSFARGRLDETVVLLVHALPDAIRVEVRDDDGRLLASSDQLERTADRPMARLVRDGAAIRREDIWPGQEDIGRPVILPGGEVGILTAWWNADDGSEWRWSIELYNHR